MDPAAIRTFLRKRFSRVEAVGLYFTVSLLLCLALSASFALLARKVSMTTITPKSFDGLVGGFLYALRSPGRTHAMELVTFFGDARFVVLATAAVSLGLALAHRRVSALLFIGTVAGGFVLMSAFKIAFFRARPQLWPALVQETTYSFPSGHATMSTVFFGGLVAVVFHLSRRRLHRVLATGVACVFVAGVAVSRIYLGAHWATDTIAGILLGLFWVVLYATGTEFVARAARRTG
jgi:undecaprenyl-diphosphatase